KGKHTIPDADKDFGLPRVEITPIQDEAKPIPLQQTEQKEGTPDADPNRDTLAVKGTAKAKMGEPDSGEKSKGGGLKWLLLLLILLILAAGGWFYLDTGQQPTIPEKPVANEVP